jgi:glycerol-1-phosphate dehydrogenase [NAD(P)+]
LKKIELTNSIHRIDLPRIVLVGEFILNKLSEICKELQFNKSLIVTGNTTYNIAGKKTEEILEEADISSKCIFVKDATIKTVEAVIENIQNVEAEVVLGVGGGRNIDVAKLAAAKTDRFFISVPTVASHDGIASSLASVKGMGRPYTVKAVSPIAVVMDSGIIEESPYRFTASGCGDIISKAVEVEDWRLAHKDKGEYYGEYAGSLSLMSSVHVMNSAKNIQEKTQNGIRTLLEALVSCGVAMSIAGSSRPTSGSSHLFSHALDIITKSPALHGEQCGVGAIMMSKLHQQDWKKIRRSLETIGAPINAKQLGIKEDNIIKALTIAQSIRPDRYTILSKIQLNEKKANSLAKETMVI